MYSSRSKQVYLYQLMILFIMFFIIVKVFLIRQSSFPKTAAVIHKWGMHPALSLTYDT
ncbi:hypothetical protein B4140_2189 [Bacillus amyloliquefaciens]|nr:hypothetical protein B4140_2189 [Bacillus amyloliquefaciens]